MVTLLHHQVGNGRLVVLFKLPASILYGNKLVGQHSQELALAASVPEHYQLLRLSFPILLEELQQKVLRHILHVLYDFLVTFDPHLLDSHLDFIINSPEIHFNKKKPLLEN